MVQTITQLVDEMQALRDRLASGTAERASGDVDAAIDALDGALALLNGKSAPENDTPDVPPYAIVAAEPGPPDNLTLIRGISSATAYALTNLGITRFVHISGLTARDVTQLGRDLGYRCTIHRDNWIEQAAVLAAGGSTRFSRRGGPLASPAPEVAATHGDQPDASADTAPPQQEQPVMSAGLSATLAGSLAAATTASIAGNPDASPTGEIPPVPAEPSPPGNFPVSRPLEELTSVELDPDSTGHERPTEAGTLITMPAGDQAAAGEPDRFASDEAQESIGGTREPALEYVLEPEPLIEVPETIEEHDPIEEDNVFATLPEPIAIVPRAVKKPDPLADDPAVSGVLVPEPAVPEPKTVPIIEGLEASAILAMESPDLPDDATLASGALIDAIDTGGHSGRSMTSSIAAAASDVDDYSPVEPETLVDMRAPLDFAPTEPIFAPIIHPEHAPSAGADAVNVSDTHSPVEPESPAPGAVQAFRTGMARANRPEASVPGGTNGLPGPGTVTAATIDPLPEPFSPHRTVVGEAEIVIVRDGKPEKPDIEIPEFGDRSGGIVGRLTRAFRRK